MHRLVGVVTERNKRRPFTRRSKRRRYTGRSKRRPYFCILTALYSR